MFKKSTLTLFILSSVYSSYSLAQTSTNSFAINDSNTNQLSRSVELKQKDNKKDKGLRGSFSFTSNEIVEDVGDQVGNKYFGELDLDYDSGGGPDLIKKFSLRSRVNDVEQLMFSVPESYLKYEFGNSELVFGRQILNWSTIDANWGFGSLNNRVNFDFLEPGQEGLTGVMYDLKVPTSFGHMKLGVFGSFVYIPEMNPGQKIDEETGEVTCQNMWCKPLANTAPIGDKDVPIFYNVEYPEISDVVFRYSVGARLNFAFGEHFEVDAFAIRKPENTVSITAEIQYQTDENRVFVDATPQFYYHDVKGASLKVKPTDNFTVYAGGLSILPNSFPDGDEPYIQYTGIKPQKISQDYLGGGAFYANDNYTAGIHYIARVSEYDIENEILVEYPRWNQAYHVNFNARLSRKFSAGFDFKYDMLTEDRLTMFNANYQLRPNITTSLGVNILGTNDDTKSFWSDYSNNDSVYASMKYLF